MKTKLFGTAILEEYEGEAGGSNYLVASATNTPYFKSYPETGYMVDFNINPALLVACLDRHPSVPLKFHHA